MSKFLQFLLLSTLILIISSKIDQNIDSETCEEYNNQNECTKCNSHYWMFDNKECKKCEKPCLSCTGPSPQQCASCVIGYYFEKESQICQPCIDKWKDCRICDQNQCLQCELEFSRSKNGRCTNCAKRFNHCKTCGSYLCRSCQDGYFQDHHDQKCKACVPDCIDCVYKRCFECKEGYFLTQNDTCEKCKSSLMVNCLKCDDNECIQCKAGYYSENGTCQRCGDNCDVCVADYCWKCASGYYVPFDHDKIPEEGGGYQGNCEQCEFDNCVDCSHDGCTQCESGFYLSENLKQCKECHQDNCIECNQFSCIRCIQGFELKEKTCVVLEEYESESDKNEEGEKEAAILNEQMADKLQNEQKFSEGQSPEIFIEDKLKKNSKGQK